MWCPSILYALVFLAAVAAEIWSPLINGSAGSSQSGSDIYSGCILPEQPVGGRFELYCHGSSCSGSPGSRVHGGTFLTYSCSKGYFLQGNPLTFCYGNTWLQPPACIKRGRTLPEDPATCSDNSTITSSKSGCVLPDQPTAGSFELRSSEGQCNVTTGSRVPIGSLLTYTCDQGYTLVGNNVSVCYDDVWFPPPTNCVKKYCPALRVAGVNFDCKLQGKNVSCEFAIAPGTRATLACKYFYEFLPGNDIGYREITCLENGTWDRAVVECVPAECGRAVPDGTQVVVDGSKISPRGFPWHVHVYFSRNSTASFSILTMATLISPNLVLSNAWNLVVTISNKVEGVKFAVTAGNYHTSYGTLESYAQKSLVSRIVVEKGFNGPQAHFTHNRALLYLETFFEVTAFVRPICMDWYGRVEEELIENKNWDKLVGWYDYLSTSGNKTYKLALRYIPYEECHSRVTGWARFITNDTFCVVCSSGEPKPCDPTTVMPVGFGYEFHGVWYLLGLHKISIYYRFDDQTGLIISSKVLDHSDWIRRDWIRNLEY